MWRMLACILTLLALCWAMLGTASADTYTCHKARCFAEHPAGQYHVTHHRRR